MSSVQTVLLRISVSIFAMNMLGKKKQLSLKIHRLYISFVTKIGKPLSDF